MHSKLLLPVLLLFIASLAEVAAQGCSPDLTAPVGVCRSFTTVSLSNNGQALVDAKYFDEGSHDNCGQVFFKVARASADKCGKTKFDDKVTFCCSDIGLTTVVRLKIFDKMPVWGEVSENYDAGGNVNECVVNVLVEDYVPPTISCPPSVTVNCDAYFLNSSNLSEGYMDNYLGRVALTTADRRALLVNIANDGKNFGVPVGFDGLASDNCSVQSISVSSTRNLSTCGIGNITRKFTAIDKGGRSASCLQDLTILPGKTIGAANIIWPLDTTLTACNGSLNPDSLPDPYRRPVVFGNGCGQTLYTYRDEFYTITSPGCRKILRYWKVIDWCSYNVNQPDGPGQWTHTQVFKITTNIAPVFDTKTCQNDTICVYPKSCKLDTVRLTAVAKSGCVPSSSLNYFWKIDLNDDGTLDLSGYGSVATLTAASGLTYGTHRVMWAVEDGCGNVETCHKLFTVKNCTKPTPVAKFLSVNLMPHNCLLSLDAAIVNNFSWDNCTPMDKLRFRLARNGSFPAKPTLSEVLALNQYVIFDGFDVGKTVKVALFVIDEDNNFDYVVTNIIVQSNMASCDSNITTTSTMVVAIEDIAEVVAMEDVYLVVKNLKTNEEKTYNPAGNQAIVVPTIVGDEYTITPHTKKTNILENINSLDLVKIYRHIQGLDTIKHPYLKIAANINNDNKISLSDVVDLRKVLLQSQDYFTNNSNWKFVCRNQALSKLDANFNAFTFKAQKQNNPITFMAIKTGDVYNKMLTDFGSAQDRGNTMVAIPDVDFSANEVVKLAVELTDIAQVEALQLSFAYDAGKLDFENLESNIEGLSMENVGVNADKGKIILSWVGAFKPGSQVVNLQLVFRAKDKGLLSQAITFDSKDQILYGSDRVQDLQYRFIHNGTFDLLQNQPNPTTGLTYISFYLPKREAVELEFLDNNGKLLEVFGGTYERGFNRIAVDVAKWQVQGVVYYRLKGAAGMLTKKMVIIN